MDEITMFAELRPQAPDSAELDAMRAAARGRLVTALGGPRRAARRRWRVTIATAAAAAGIAIAAVVTVGAKAPAPVSTRTTAYVVSHAEAALAGVTSQNLIEYSWSTTSGDLPGSPPVASWIYRGDWRSATYDAAGRIAHDSGTRVVGHTDTDTVVDYAKKTWWRNSFTVGTFPTPHRFSCATPNVAWLPPSDMVTRIRLELRCGQYKVAGTERVDGVQALKLKQVHPDAQIATVLWVDQATFLPVREVETFGSRGSQQTDIRWLRPTPANLANVEVPIPAGFTHISVQAPEPRLP